MHGLRHFVIACALGANVLAIASCRKASRAWRADDHDDEQTSSLQVAATGAPNAGGNDEALVDATWRGACASCHGIAGRGDGPQGPMVKPPDLTNATFQDNRSDEAFTQAIRAGKGKMPAFASLPPNVLAGLVKRVRSLRAP